MHLTKHYREYYNIQSRNYDKILVKYPYEEYRNNQITENILSLIPEKDNLTILDVGCGTGENTIKPVLNKLKSPRITGIDFSDGMVKMAARKFPDCKIIVADVHKLPFNDENFDVVISREVFEHLMNPLQAMKEIKRVTKRNGCIIISTPSWFGLAAPFYFAKNLFNKMEMIERWWTPFSLKNIIKSAGLKLEVMRGIIPVLYNEYLPSFLISAVSRLDRFLVRFKIIAYFGRIIIVKARRM